MDTADLGTFIVMCLWTMPFVLGRHLRLGASIGRRSWLSVAAGISIAYVFMDLLPEMSRMQVEFTAASRERALPFPQFRVYFSAMVGFVVFYVLENMVVLSRPARQEKEQGQRSLAYRVHLAGFVLYCTTMAYLLQDEARENALSLTLYALAMFFHFWVVDHSLRREHGGPYDTSGRWIIASGIFVGWALGLSGYTSGFIMPTLLGFIGGGVVINSIKEELPEKGEGSALPFVLGTSGYALLLLLIELKSNAHVE